MDSDIYTTNKRHGAVPKSSSEARFGNAANASATAVAPLGPRCAPAPKQVVSTSTKRPQHTTVVG